MGDSTTPSKRIGALLAGQAAERDQLARRHQDQARERILKAAKVEPDALTDRARRVLDWLADWDTSTIEGVVELLTASRLAVYVECHRADIAVKDQAVSDSAARLDAAMARYDAKFGIEPKAVEL